jgi:dihydrofolate synthase/folylpolyglutamate synthase
MDVIRQTCRERGVRLYRLKSSKLKADARRLRFSYDTDTLRLTNIAPSLVGTHQLKNAALAAEAINVLRLHGSVAVSQRSVIRGIQNTGWPGRFQILARNGHPTLVLDVAHNAAGMEAFVDSFEKKYPGRKTSIIVGFVKRKPHQRMFDSLSRIASDYAIVPLSTKRSIDIDEMMRSLRWRGVAHRRYGTLATAYRRVLQSARGDDIITVIGSHYLVGDFLGMLGWK